MGQSTKEESINVMNGWTVLVVTLLGFASFIGLMVFFIVSAVNESPQFWALITAIPTLLASIFAPVVSLLYNPMKQRSSRCLVAMSAQFGTMDFIGPTHFEHVRESALDLETSTVRH